MDGVLSNFVGNFLDKANAKYSLNVQYSDIVDPKLEEIFWNQIPNSVKIEQGLATSIDFMRAVIGKGFFNDLKPYPNSILAVKMLAEKYDIVFITKPFEYSFSTQEKKDWLYKHFGNIEYNLILVDHFSTKRLIDVDVIIDDEPRVLEHLTTQLGICVKQPWNKSWLEMNQELVHSSIEDMIEVCDVVKQIEKEIC
jgi:5'(3')-deoxyribonucleotidase